MAGKGKTGLIATQAKTWKESISCALFFLHCIGKLAKRVPAEYTDMKTGKSLSHQEVLSCVKARFK